VSLTAKSGHRELTKGLSVVLLTFAMGMTIVLQGWRSRVPDEEEIYSIVQAHALIEPGEIPVRGGVTNYGSYFPP
jgi:hypothetical protein